MDTEVLGSGTNPPVWQVHVVGGSIIGSIEGSGTQCSIKAADETSPLAKVPVGPYESREAAMAAIGSHLGGSCQPKGGALKD